MSLNTPPTSRLIVLSTLLCLIFFNPVDEAYSQNSQNSYLYRELVKADSLLFKEGFNNCEIAIVEDIIHSDLEFYHDISGTENREEFLHGFKNNICSTPDQKPIRRLVAGSMKVFALKNNGKLYGAIQKGKHRFYIKEIDKEPYYTTSAKFTHLWIIEDGRWKLKTGLSYDHGK